MRFDFYYDCIVPDEDTISLADWTNVVIGVINLFIVVYIFRNQRKKDKDDRAFQIQAKSQEYKHNWFKELIVLPNLPTINSHFLKLEQITKKLQENGLTPRQRANIDKKIKAEFSQFSKEFIELLFSVNLDLANRLQDFSDQCLDAIQREIYNPSASLADESNYNRIILNPILTYKNMIFGHIFNFES